ncbi:GGDEF domain-containing protein [Pseudobutyrivibrio ruminis]|uniref:GGDEF domain-containing protein n=1 Tax=Pseudobutyrivibrio ruminis TaxID=46206 RepID=UPI0003F9D71B|nr:GGDEF domain-containing protein [Pseudobutyrivibrio ruminis]
MMESVGYVKTKKIIILPILFSFIIVFIAVFGGSWLNTSSATAITNIDSGWFIRRGNQTIDNVVLTEYPIGNSRRGERIVATNYVTVITNATTLMFLSNLMAVDVSLDGKVIDTYGHDFLASGSFIPKRYNMITLDTTPGMHEITIEYTIGDDRSVYHFFPVYIGQKGDLMKSFFSHNRVSIFIGSFLIVYACVFFSLWIYLMLTKRPALQIYIGADFSMILGCFILARNNVLCFLGAHELLFSMMEYLSFYFIPLAFSVLLYSIRPSVANTRQRFFILINIAIPIIILSLHFAKVIYINRFLFFVGFIGTIEICILLPALITDAIKQRKERRDFESIIGDDSDYYIVLGIIIMLVSGLLELVLVYCLTVNQSVVEPKLLLSIDFLELGMLIFMTCHFVFYFLSSINHMSVNYVKARLEDMAYTDSLTGLRNRTALNQFYSMLKGNYVIVSIDLDGLKEVNDNLGHLEGDRMIRVFARLLTYNFEDADIIARTGGDEFVIVRKNTSAYNCNRCINMLLKEIELFNANDEKIQLSASIGFAFSSEVNTGRYQDVFYLADNRMYEMKEAHYEEKSN